MSPRSLPSDGLLLFCVAGGCFWLFFGAGPAVCQGTSPSVPLTASREANLSPTPVLLLVRVGVASQPGQATSPREHLPEGRGSHSLASLHQCTELDQPSSTHLTRPMSWWLVRAAQRQARLPQLHHPASPQAARQEADPGACIHGTAVPNTWPSLEGRLSAPYA